MAKPAILLEASRKLNVSHSQRLMESLADPTAKVEVYRNLNCKEPAMWSVRQRGIVQYHTDYICLKDVQFVVQPAGRERVRREQKKFVHAFLRGVVTDAVFTPYNDEIPWQDVTYNPYKYDTFVIRESGKVVTSAPFADADLTSNICPKVLACINP